MFEEAESLFVSSYKRKPDYKITSYGRLELIGNHTDHQGGLCLVAGCSLGIRGALKKRDDGVVSITSKGYGGFFFDVNDTEVKDGERGTSVALTRGVLDYLKMKGKKVGGFEAAIVSDIFPGAGVSSSAAYELFVAEAENALYNDGSIDRLLLAEAGRHAENVYFGKASGLLDQCGSSFGGVNFLDFSGGEAKVERISFGLKGLRIALVNPGSSHAGLSDLYSEMPSDMRLVAKKVFGKEVLSEVSEEEFYSKISEPLRGVPERARRRALHYFGEVARVRRAKEALEKGDAPWFLELERESELSQESLLGNVMIEGHYEGSPLEAIRKALPLIGEGASRVMGGGLVGSTLNFVPEARMDAFLKGMRAIYGKDAVVEVSIPDRGAHVESI